MRYAQTLPAYLVTRYKDWQTTSFQESHGLYKKLAEEGQQPRAMVISCCDSRVNVLSILGSDPGQFFTHRNIANLVPPYDPEGHDHGTSAAIEYGVTALKVSHLLVVGHSSCGGVAGCYEMCSGRAPELEESTSFVGRWVKFLRPAFEKLPEGDDATRKRLLEKAAVLHSLENLMTFPFVKEAVADDRLSLHGLWNDIGSGVVESYDPEKDAFVPL